MSIRIFVSGLPPGVTAAELGARFTPFGEVTDCILAQPKVYQAPDGSLAVFPRDFGHVELRPKDDAALRKCISAYNGCQWRGGVLKCGLAHQHYAERLAQERMGGGEAASEAAEHPDQAALPPLGPGDTLRLRPPKSAAAVEVTLGSGTRLEDFPEEPSQPGAVATAEAWEALETPPQSGYLFEQLLQRIAANLPPELLAAVEARRERGQALREARALARREAAGVEVAYQYSDGEQASGSLQLGSDDDAGTAAAAVAAAVTSRDRRLGGASTAGGALGAASNKRQQQQQPQPQKEKRLRVIDFLREEEQQPAAAGRAGGAVAEDLSRFDSDSDAEWVGRPVPSTAARQVQPVRQPAAHQQHLPAKQQQPAVAAPVPEPQPAGSSGSSGGSELEEWLAGTGADVSADSGSEGEGQLPLEEEYADVAGEDADVADSGDDEQEAISDSSGGSELEEWLAQEGGSPGTAAVPQAEAESQEQEEPEQQEQREAAMPAAAPPPQPQLQLPQHQQQWRQAQQERQQQRGVVDFLQQGGQPSMQQRRQKPLQAADLSRFASSSDDEEQPVQQGSKWLRERVIPQVDGATDSVEDEDSSSSEEESDSDVSSGSESDSGDSDANAVGSGSSSSDDESSGSEALGGSDSSGEEGTVAAAAGKPPLHQAAAAGKPPLHQAAAADAKGSGSSGSGSEGEEEGTAGTQATEAAAVAAAAEQRQQAALAALFLEGAAFKRSEPLAQIEASWRVSREAWAQDYRQKHRQAVRLLGRASGGGGKRQRKG